MTLLEKQNLFAAQVALLIKQGQSMGYTITLGEAWRSDETAALDSQEGKGISHSLHRVRLAIDLNLFKDGTLLIQSQDYQPLGEWWESQSLNEITCIWGGRFQKPDGDHFSFEHEGIK